MQHDENHPDRSDHPMSPRISRNRWIAPMLVCAAFMIAGASPVMAQGYSGGIELHANERVSAATMGLPDYPDARPFRDAKSDSAVDMGFTFGSVHFRLLMSAYVTSASSSDVLDFYRKPLARFGDVLECDHGEAVGDRKETRSGLTCSDSDGHHSHGDADDGHQLRSGTPRVFRIVAIDRDRTETTRFTLLMLEVPKDGDSH
jgi:hypothetical protein